MRTRNKFPIISENPLLREAFTRWSISVVFASSVTQKIREKGTSFSELCFLRFLFQTRVRSLFENVPCRFVPLCLHSASQCWFAQVNITIFLKQRTWLSIIRSVIVLFIIHRGIFLNNLIIVTYSSNCTCLYKMNNHFRNVFHVWCFVGIASMIFISWLSVVFFYPPKEDTFLSSFLF